MSRHQIIIGLATLSMSTLIPGLSTARSGTERAPATVTEHVRPSSQEGRDLLADGISHSPTLARLVAELEHTDLLVRIELSAFLPTAGDLRLVGGTSMFRYVQIRLKIPNSRVEMMASLGHELQHALELASESSVRDDAGMRRLYEHIGRDDWTGGRFETRAASEIGWRVRDELMEHRTTLTTR